MKSKRRKLSLSDRYDEVLGQLYEAAVDELAWPAALTALGDLSSSIGGHLLVWDLKRHAPVASLMANRFPEVNADYLTYYGAIDPRLQLVRNMPVGQALACHHYFDGAYVRRDEFYNDFLIPNGGRFVAGCRLLEAGGQVAFFGLHRSLKHGPFESADMELFERLMPHLTRAAVIRRQLQGARAESVTFQAALDRLPTAIFVVAGTGAVLAMNQAGHELVRLGHALVLRQGRLGAKRSEDEARLLGFVRQAANAASSRGAGGGSLRLFSDAGGGYVALVAPLVAERTVAAGQPAALVLVSDATAAPKTLGRTLVELYGFSQAEARLAVLLAQGRTLKEAADERRVGIETVRSQLRSLLAKSGARRQADLVRLLVRLPEIRSASMAEPSSAGVILKV